MSIYPGPCQQCGEWRESGTPCPECSRRRARKWGRDHRERRRLYMREYRKRKAREHWAQREKGDRE